MVVMAAAVTTAVVLGEEFTKPGVCKVAILVPMFAHTGVAAAAALNVGGLHWVLVGCALLPLPAWAAVAYFI